MATPIRFTARDVLTAAFADLGIFQPGETIPAPDANGAFSRLNAFVSTLSQSPLSFPYVAREVFPVVPFQNTYTIGPGGDFDTIRPTELTGAGILYPLTASTTGRTEQPIGLMTDDAYQLNQVKDLQNSLWTDLYFNPTYAGGLASIYLWPTPTTTQYDCVIYYGSTVQGFASLNATYDFPPGVFEMLQYQLGKRLAPGYGGTCWTGALEEMARDTLFVYKRNNFKLTDLQIDPAVTSNRRGGYNIQTGSGG